MSDTYRRYRAIKQAIMQFYQPRPSGHREKHLNTLVALICGLTGGKVPSFTLVSISAQPYRLEIIRNADHTDVVSCAGILHR